MLERGVTRGGRSIPLCVQRHSSRGPPWFLEHGFVLRQGYVTGGPGQAGHNSQPRFVPTVSSSPSPSGAVALTELFFKLQG